MVERYKEECKSQPDHMHLFSSLICDAELQGLHRLVQNGPLCPEPSTELCHLGGMWIYPPNGLCWVMLLICNSVDSFKAAANYGVPAS